MLTLFVVWLIYCLISYIVALGQIGNLKEYHPIKMQFIFAVYDFWVGAYADRASGVVYWFSIPCLGLKIVKVRR